MENYRTVESDQLHEAWSFLNEYYDFRRLACRRRKVEEQLRNANISLTHVPWKLMVRTVLCDNLFGDEQLKEMNASTTECCTEVDIVLSQTVINGLLGDDEENINNLTETWIEIDELKQSFQRASDHIPINRKARMEMMHRILGYPTGYSEEEMVGSNTNLSLDLTRVLPIDEQNQMHTGDLIEFSGNRLHDAFYIYRLPQKGIWSQIQQMWSKHQITNFVFNETETSVEEIILVPAKDEYGYGVPYLFAARPTELLPDGALYKYIDINCPLIAMHTENSTIALVQKHLNERLNKPQYQDKYMGEEMSIELDRFPQEYVAIVHIDGQTIDNVVWTRLMHYNGKEGARDLNDNFEIFCSRRILEAEQQYRQKQSHT
ncbi:unnamed protein product [Adineta steineri]|uniref:Uncharacterized protein n=1 Tax=Adineta steineri TaxID=433720 RepID=A0A814PQL2_9BILA|nr:unnamed protein product [Adineta steineri]